MEKINLLLRKRKMTPELSKLPNGDIAESFGAEGAVNVTATKSESLVVEQAAGALGKTPQEIREMIASGEQVKW